MNVVDICNLYSVVLTCNALCVPIIYIIQIKSIAQNGQ